MVAAYGPFRWEERGHKRSLNSAQIVYLRISERVYGLSPLCVINSRPEDSTPS